MSKTWVMGISLVVARYLASVVAGAMLSARATQEDTNEISRLLTDPEFVAWLALFLAAAGGGIAAWVRSRWLALTAAAMPGTSTMNQVSAVAKTSAPAISTPPSQVPMLSSPSPMAPNAMVAPDAPEPDKKIG